MKKKLLLIALPALMVLSGCANIQKEQPKVEEQPAVEFEEDTTACEEIFGEAVEAKQPAIRKMDVVDTQDDYKIGYQIHFDDKEDENAANDVISIRFIAAINATYSSMVWSRGISAEDGDVAKAFGNKRSDGTTPLASSVVYSSLSNGGEDIMRAEQGDYAAYTGFIVYSIRNIPYEDNKDYYIGVSLLMDAVQTDFYAVKIETNGAHSSSTDAFKLSNTKDAYLRGTINGSEQFVGEKADIKGLNKAAFETDFVEDDSFYIIEKSSTAFKFWNSSSLTYDGNTKITSCFENNSGEIKLKDGKAGNYRLFLNGEGRLYTEEGAPYNVHNSFYIKGDMNSWTATDSWRLYNDRDNRAVSHKISLEYNQEFKVWEDSGGEGYWYGWPGQKVSETADWFVAKSNNTGDNIVCKHAGDYILFVNSDGNIWLNPVD